MIQLEMKSKTQAPEYIKDVKPENYWMIFNTNTRRMKSSIGTTCETGKGRAIERNSTPNIFLVQNKGKGPPGRQRSPGAQGPHPSPLQSGEGAWDGAGIKGFTLINSLPEASPLWGRFGGGFLTNKKYNDYKFYKFNFFQLLNSITMKKQIYLLAFFVLALFAGTMKSYGQCADDPQHPRANKEYTYSATNTPGTSPVYSWYVTLSTDIKNGTKETSGGGLFTMTDGTTANAKITWTAAAIEYARNNPIFVALWYSETSTSTTNCTVENVRAIQIKPVNSFLLAITGVDGSGVTQTTTCAAPVVSAVVDHPATGTTPPENATMAITYGLNTITYKITASGVEGDWSPRIQIPALGSGQTYASIEWSTQPNSGFAAFAPTAATGAGTYTATATDVPVTVAGSSYYVRLVINQGSYESLSAQAINVAVDGYLAANHTVSDIDDSGNCTEATAFYRNADVTILPRPNLVPGNPVFMTKTP